MTESKKLSKVEQEKDRIRKEREQRDEQKLDAVLATPMVGRAIPPDVDTTNPAEMAKQDPRIGEQDVPPDERVDGYTAGVRHDQMEGVQAAARNNDLDPDELIEENLEHPRNVAVREDRVLNENLGLRRGEKAPGVSPRTAEEMDRGREALNRRDVEHTSARRRASDADRKREADKKPATKA